MLFVFEFWRELVMQAKTGKSDMNVTGVLDNFYGYLFNKQNLKGNFNLTSNQLAVADFMTTSETENKDKKETTLNLLKN